MKVQFSRCIPMCQFKGIIPLIAFLFLFTCQKEEEPFHEQQVSLDIEKVKQAFNNQFNKKAFSNITNDPLWEHALPYQKDKINYLEIPFRSLDEFNLELSTSISMDRLMASIDKNGNLNLNIVHYYAKDITTYLPDFTQLNYTNQIKFNGYVTLYDMDKNRIEVKRYRDGILSKGSYNIVKNKNKNKNDLDNLRVDEGCYMETETTVIRHIYFWIYTDGSVEIISINDEYIETQYEVCDGDGGGGAGTTVVNNEIYVNVINNLTGKAKCVYDKLFEAGNQLFRETVGAFIDDPNYNLTFQIGNCTTTNDACTNDSNPNNIIITIEDTNLSAIELGQFILHEAMHAEMARFVSQYQSGVDVNDRPRLFQLYKHYKDTYSTGNIEHVYMTEKYINPMANALRVLDGNRYSIDYYKSFAWDGLRAWDANNLLSMEMDQTYNSYRNTVIQNSEVCD